MRVCIALLSANPGVLDRVRWLISAVISVYGAYVRSTWTELLVVLRLFHVAKLILHLSVHVSVCGFGDCMYVRLKYLHIDSLLCVCLCFFAFLPLSLLVA